MGWFMDGPEDKFKRIPTAVNDWWDSIIGWQDPEEVIEYRDLCRTILLCGSTQALIDEHTRRFGGDPLPRAVAGWREPGVLAMLFKRTTAGKVVVNEWALGHEDMHDIDKRLKLDSNPDDVDKASFYGKVS